MDSKKFVTDYIKNRNAAIYDAIEKGLLAGDGLMLRQMPDRIREVRTALGQAGLKIIRMPKREKKPEEKIKGGIRVTDGGESWKKWVVIPDVPADHKNMSYRDLCEWAWKIIPANVNQSLASYSHGPGRGFQAEPSFRVGRHRTLVYTTGGLDV